MDWKTFFTISASIIVAALAATLAYQSNRRLAQRKDRLDRVNRQLSEFYGPLLALVQASNSSWEAFRKKYRPSSAYWLESSPPTAEEAKIWRIWITEVFMPLNRKMMDVVVSKADLLSEQEMPPCLLALCAHVVSYEPVLRAWTEGDFSENKSFLPFPGLDLHEYAVRSFAELKTLQTKLL